MDKNKINNSKQKKEIEKIEVEIKDSKLPFSKKYVDIYLISSNKCECEKYIKKLDKKIRKYFKIRQVGSEIRYTAFIDILGFSKYIESKITNVYEGEEFYDKFSEVVKYLKKEKKDNFDLKNAKFLKYMKIKYSWISDSLAISIEYLNDIREKDKNIIKSMMIFRLCMMVSSIHHYMASEFGFIVRGGISTKYSCITDNFILGNGITEAFEFEKSLAVYPRVVFGKDIINDEIYNLIKIKYNDNDLNFVSKDFDGYYFVNYIAMLQEIPPLIGKSFKITQYNPEVTALELKIKTIEKYQEIVKSGFNITNERLRIKYTWLNEYLGRVLLNEKFQNNLKENIED